MAADADAKGETGRAQAFRRKAYGDPSADESKAYGFANRMDASEQILSRIDGVGADAVETVRSFFGNMASTPMRRQYEQAQRDFINATLRRESGAVIGESEFTSARAQYFPQVGDDPQTIAQKRANRNNVRASIRQAGGRANLIFGHRAQAPAAAPPQQPAPTREGNASDRYAGTDWRGPPQSAPASMMAAQAQSRPRPGAVRRDEFGGGMSPGGRAGGDEFASPFDASGLAAPSPFDTMGRAGLMQVDPNTLDDASLAAYVAAMGTADAGWRMMAEDMQRQLMLAKAEALRRGLASAQPSNFDPGMMQLEASAAFDETQQRRMDAMHAPQGPSQAGLPAMMPGRAPQPEMRTQAPPPSDHGAPPIPGPVGMPMSLAQYATDTVRNAPGSLKGVGEDLWGAVTGSDRHGAGRGRNRSRRCAARQRLPGHSEQRDAGRLPGSGPCRWPAHDAIWSRTNRPDLPPRPSRHRAGCWWARGAGRRGWRQGRDDGR